MSIIARTIVVEGKVRDEIWVIVKEKSDKLTSVVL